MRSWLPWRALTILAVVTALLGAGLPASAADGPLTVHAPVTDATVAPGSDVSFAFSIWNSQSTLKRSVEIELLAGDAAWPASVTPDGRHDVPAEGWLNGTVVVNVPADAAASVVQQYVLLVKDTTGPFDDDTYRVDFTVTTEASRVHSNGTPQLTLTPASDGAEAAPGERVVRHATVLLTDQYNLLVNFAAEAPAAWSAEASPSSAFLRDGESRLVSLAFTVPDDADVNSTHLVVLRAQADDGSAEDVASWTVAIVPPAPAPDEGEDANATSTNSSAPADEPPEDADADEEDASGDGNATTSDATPRVLELLTLALDAPTLRVTPGESVVSTLTLTNPGDAARAVTITAPVQDGWRVAFEEGSSVTVPAGGALTVRFSVTAPVDAAPGDAVTTLVRAEEATGELALTVAAPAAAGDASSTTADANGLATQDAPANAPLDAVLAQYGAGPVLAAAGAVTAVGGGIWLRGAPHVRRNLWWMGIGAYTRLTRPKLLDHAERQRLYATIQENPGIHFHALQRELGWNTGALTYHLRVLERHQMVTSRRDGIMRRFYLVGTAPREMPKAVNASGKAVTLTGIRGSVLTIVNHRGRVPQAALVDELGTSKQSINYHVKNLERLGLLHVERVGRETFLTPAEDVQLTGLEHAAAVAPNADATAARPGPGIALAGGDDE